MNYNAVKMLERIMERVDRTKTARFSDIQVMNSINAAINNIVKNRIDPIRKGGRYSIQSVQRLRDELYTLIPSPPATGVGSDLIAFPADYLSYLLLYITIDGERQTAFPTDYNEEGVLFNDPFVTPDSEFIYFNESAGGLRILKGATATYGNYEFHYVKIPAVVSVGKESQKITAGGTLVAGANNYIVYDESVYNTVTYYPGDLISGTGIALTSGTVILVSNTTNCDLPGNMHEEICEVAAKDLSSDVEDWNKKQSLDMDSERE